MTLIILLLSQHVSTPVAQGGGRHDTGGESAQSDDDFTVSRKPRVKALRSAGSALPQGRMMPRRILEHSEAESSQLLTSPEDCSTVEVRKRVNTPKPRGGKKNSAPPKPHKKTTKGKNGKAVSRVGLQEEEVEDAAQWTVAELARLHQ